jgi:two-component system, LytTR family, sensor kinase
MANKSFQEIAGFNDKWIVAIGLPIASIMISILLFYEYFETKNWEAIAVCTPISLVYTAVFWFCLRAIYMRLKTSYPNYRDIGKRILWILISVTILHFVVDFVLDRFFRFVMPDNTNEPDKTIAFVSTLLMSSLVISIYEAISFYLQLGKAISEKSELERQHVSSQLEGLRNQVNPHFLFNSLNTLTYLIPEDSDKAVRFVQQLSKVYRFILESRESGLIPLQEEVEFLNAYIFLQKERFGDNLHVQLADLSQASSVYIVPLSLQMLFENAIKHNVISTEKPLSIEVYMENDHLIVRNNLQRHGLHRRRPAKYKRPVPPVGKQGSQHHCFCFQFYRCTSNY